MISAHYKAENLYKQTTVVVLQKLQCYGIPQFADSYGASLPQIHSLIYIYSDIALSQRTQEC